MAEFTEVMRQAKRMCSWYGNDCEGCPLHKDYGNCPLVAPTGDYLPMEWDLEGMQKNERIVMHWAAEHPEPKYPSWNKGWKELFSNAADKVCPCPKHFLDDARWDSLCDGRTCAECLETPIPADIAEKLGIKPIGGTDNE